MMTKSTAAWGATADSATAADSAKEMTLTRLQRPQDVLHGRGVGGLRPARHFDVDLPEAVLEVAVCIMVAAGEQDTVALRQSCGDGSGT